MIIGCIIIILSPLINGIKIDIGLIIVTRIIRINKFMKN